MLDGSFPPRPPLKARRGREIGTSVLAGLVLNGVIAAPLYVGGLELAPAAGAAIGGFYAAYMHYGRIKADTLVGFLSGLLGYLFFYGLMLILTAAGLYTPPQIPTPPIHQLQTELALELTLNLVSGAFGGFVAGILGRQAKPAHAPESPEARSVGGVVPLIGVKNCLQCGGQLSSNLSVCPHCGAKQPEDSTMKQS